MHTNYLKPLAMLLALWFTACENEELNELDQILSETSQPGNILTDAEIAGLPVLIQKHMRFAGVVGAPKHFNVKMTGSGAMKQAENAKWTQLDYSFYLIYKPVARFWFGEMATDIGNMSGFDYYRNGKGRLSIRYEPSVSFQEADDDKTTLSELITFMGEHVYNPSAFANSYFIWLGETDSTVTASITDAGLTVSGTYYFNTEGRVMKFISHERYKGSGNDAIKQPWEVTVDGYKTFQGIQIPTTFKATWLNNQNNFEYIHGTIKYVAFDVKEMQN